MMADPRMVRVYADAFADVECAICHRHVSDDMSLMVDTERGLLVVCWRCDEKRDPGFDERDDDADE